MSGIALANAVNTGPTIPFNSTIGSRKFDETALRVRNFNGLLSINLLSQLAHVTNEENKMTSQAALCLMFNILQFSRFILMSEYTKSSAAQRSFYAKLMRQEPILIAERDFMNLRLTKEFFKSESILSRGMTMGDVVLLIATKLPFAVIKHYTASDQESVRIKEKVRINRDDIFLTTSNVLKDIVSQRRKWEDQTGLLACFDMTDIWPGQSGPVIAPIVATNGDYMLVISPMHNLKDQWVRIDVMYSAMLKVDTRTALPGGIVEIYMPYP